MTKTRTAAMLVLGLMLAQPAVAEVQAQRIPPELVTFEKGLHKQTGDVAIPAAHAQLHLGDRYYFVPADEAKTILTKVWGNPPQSADGVLGIVFEKGRTIFDNVWGAVVTYEDTGYVSDANAKSEDYNQVLESIRKGESEENTKRKQGGFPQLHLVGWAQPPAYDPASHALIWARDIRFSDSATDALNYDVRLLGRRGVLSLNMLSSMDHLSDVRAAAADFGKAAAFDRGSAYADFDKTIDKSAGYGLAGLVAAGAGVVVAKKLGLLAIALGFGKYLLAALAVGVAGMRRFFGRIFGRKNAE
ncbi:DUF2167 domain-containing protein [Sphingomonas populi]|uniref:DUF2167 domain-containing protein n=1 Tax=Sphingomonas populi TaxID=2484750 RepID=A0A4Q6Y5Z2_9SPHN|nr:DUF2167 domain-containing protein [Sphingomonas populi]RZF64857.1 DUF2167 domain-containing protein [Sphingomonas populi]